MLTSNQLPITKPEDIRNKQFSKKTIGGVCPHEVEDFLNLLASDWASLQHKNQALENELKTIQMELERIKKLENTLIGSLEDAKNIKAKELESAKHEADLIIDKSKVEGKEIIENARAKTRKMIDEAENLCREKIIGAQKDLKQYEQQKVLIEAHVENLLASFHQIVDRTKVKLTELDKTRHKAIPSLELPIHTNTIEERPERKQTLSGLKEGPKEQPKATGPKATEKQTELPESGPGKLKKAEKEQTFPPNFQPRNLHEKIQYENFLKQNKGV